MLEQKHVRGVGDKEQRQYERIKEAAQRSVVTASALKRSPRAPC